MEAGVGVPTSGLGVDAADAGGDMMVPGGFKMDLRGGACAGFPATGGVVSATGCVGVPTATGCVGVPTAADGALLENNAVGALGATGEARGETLGCEEAAG